MQDYRIYFILVIALVVLFFLFYCYVINKKTSKYEDKFNSFALPSNNLSKSLFDNISDFLWKIVHLFTKLFSKSKLFCYHSTSFDKYINYNDTDKSSGKDLLAIKIIFATITFVSSFVFSVIGFIDVHYIIVLLVSVLAYFIPNMILEIKYSSSSKNVSNDILTAIIVLNEALKNGENIESAILTVAKELDGDISDEFYRIHKDLEYGIDLTEAFLRFHNRVSLDSTKFISNTLNVYKEIDGNLIDIFTYIESVLEDRNSLNSELLRVTSSSRFIYRLFAILPFGALVFLSIVKVSLVVDLFINATGFFILIAIASLYILFVVLIKLVMQVKV